MPLRQITIFAAKYHQNGGFLHGYGYSYVGVLEGEPFCPKQTNGWVMYVASSSLYTNFCAGRERSEGSD